MIYDDALKYIYQLNTFSSRLDLKGIKYLLKLLGNPHNNYHTVHVGGTNGKGSTAAMINSILIKSGYKTGLFTSPYLEKFPERIKINNEEISRDEITSFIKKIIYKIEELSLTGFEKPTTFEIITTMCFDFFAKQNIDIGVMEVGLGGRFDATNVITPSVSVITPISFDHTNVLGNTIEEITYEKSGIIKKDGTTVVAPQNREADEMIQRICKDRSNNLYRVNEDIKFQLKGSSLSGTVFDVQGLENNYNDLKIKLIGEHQVINAAVAIGAIETLSMKGFHITKESIKTGLYETYWPGRMEIISKDPKILIDVAHNVHSMKILKNTIQNHMKYDNLILVLGVLRDKNYPKMVKEIVPIANTVITVEPDSNRALKVEDLVEEVKKYNCNCIIGKDIEKAIKKALEIANEKDLICFAGSIYLAGKVRSRILRK